MARIVKFRIVGISPLLMSNPGGMTRGASGIGTKKIPTPQEEAESRVYRTGDGKLYFPSIAFRSAIVGPGGGASGRRMSKVSVASRVCAGFFVQGDKCLLCHPKTKKPLTEYVISTMRVMVQKAGVLRSRPMIEEWMTELTAEVDEDFITADQLVELLNISGKVAGVGDYRPQKRGMYGRFRAELLTS